MSVWEIRITDEAIRDYNSLDNSLKKQVLAGIIKVSNAPMPSPYGYGKPLGSDLTGFFKIKYRGIGIRVVYTLVQKEKIMNIIVISKRDDNYCYKLAIKLYAKYGSDIFDNIFNFFKKV